MSHAEVIKSLPLNHIRLLPVIKAWVCCPEGPVISSTVVTRLRNNTGHRGAMRALTDILGVVIWGREGFVLVQTRTVTRKALFNESFYCFPSFIYRASSTAGVTVKNNKEAIFTVGFPLKLMFFAEPGVVSSFSK